jgi:hypothetical protein
MSVKWKKPTTLMVLGFVLLFIFMLAKCEAAETSMVIAPNTQFVQGAHQSGYLLGLRETFDKKYRIGLNLNDVGDQTNGGVQVQRIVGNEHEFFLGLGVAYWKNQSIAWNSNFTFALSVGYQWEHAGVEWGHWSTAGSSSMNSGLDAAMFTWRF